MHWIDWTIVAALARVAVALASHRAPDAPLGRSFAAWLSCCLFLYGAIVSTGCFIYEQALNGVVALIIAAVFFLVFMRQLRCMEFLS